MALQSFDYLTAFLIFVSSVILDVLIVFYTRRTTQGKAIQSALFSLIVTLVSGYVVISYVDNKIYLIFAALGAAAGNFVAVKYDHQKEK